MAGKDNDPEDWGTIPASFKKEPVGPLGATSDFPGFVFRYTPRIHTDRSELGRYLTSVVMDVDSEGKYFDESLLNFHKDCVDGLRAHIAKLDSRAIYLEERLIQMDEQLCNSRVRIKELDAEKEETRLVIKKHIDAWTKRALEAEARVKKLEAKLGAVRIGAHWRD